MKILVFDTCFNKSYIVLREDEKILENKTIESNDKNYHSAYLIPEIRNILVKHKIQIKDLDAIGVNIGPGSFTGIRAGITIARVMAQQADLKLVGIESLAVLAKINETGKNTLVVTDARKNKVYLALYDKNTNVITEPILEDRENIQNHIKEDYVIISDKSIGEYLKELGIKTICFEDNDANFGLYLSDLTYNALREAKSDFNWAKVKPLYIQKPSITKPKEVKNV